MGITRGRRIGLAVVMLAATCAAVIAGSRFEPRRVGPCIEFETTKIDFGAVSDEHELEAVFRFTNTGDEPLVFQGSIRYGARGIAVPTPRTEPK